MIRKLYIQLIWMHPAQFRYRFGDEMLADFDKAAEQGGTARLVGDALVSLLRQWALRPKIRPAWVAAEQPSGVPMFRTLDDHRISIASKVNGALLSTVLLGAAILAIGHGGANSPVFFIGSHHGRPSLLALSRASIAENDLHTQVRFPVEQEDPWRAIAVLYFRIVHVLRALDSNQDYSISRRELAAARRALSTLDLDRDGTLSPEECGFTLGPEARRQLGADVTQRARLNFMRANPAIAAIDSDRNGLLTAAEILTARTTLQALDRDGNGVLAPHEVIPDLVSQHVSIILSRLDKNGDDVLTLSERMEWEADPLRRTIETADRNGDGVITRQELIDRLKVSREGKDQLDRLLRPIP